MSNRTIIVKARPGRVLVVHGIRVTDTPIELPYNARIRRHLRLGRLLVVEASPTVAVKGTAKEGK
jgi:hypothetical protein